MMTISDDDDIDDDVDIDDDYNDDDIDDDVDDCTSIVKCSTVVVRWRGAC